MILVCKKCLFEGEPESFSRDKSKPSGFDGRCKTCIAAKGALYRSKHREKLLAKNRQWWAENPERGRETKRRSRQLHADSISSYKKKYNAEHAEEIAATTRAYRVKNAVRVAAVSRISYQRNKERHAAHNKAWMTRNKEHRAAYTASWIAKNQSKRTAVQNARRAAELGATPSWANADKIADWYLLASLVSEETGIKHHVDHTVPLKSKLVCGLHWEGNMGIAPALENMSKGNRHWPDMPTS